jgi:hypothetical protein
MITASINHLLAPFFVGCGFAATIKRFLLVFSVGCGLAATLSSCSDYFSTNPNNVINEEDYIDREDEIYKGMLGILNKVQEAGDHAIWLTDTRANILETTENAPDDLKQIYNYDSTDGNPYADPTCYYAIVIACNDYIAKMGEYHRTHKGAISEEAESFIVPLLSSTLRIKTWAYLQLGRIYGQAYWFDDPLTEKKDLSDASVFTKCDMKTLAEKAIVLLKDGITVDGMYIPADDTYLDASGSRIALMRWWEWLDPESKELAPYITWQYLTPPAMIMRMEFTSWLCNYLSEEAAQPYWTEIRNTIVDYLYSIYTFPFGGEETNYPNFPIPGFNLVGDNGRNIDDYRYALPNVYQMCDLTAGIRQQWFTYLDLFPTEGIGLKTQAISGIMYNYERNQRNRLVQYFCPEYPSADAFYLRPSDYGKGLYNDYDIRSLDQKVVMNTLGGQECVSKYFYKAYHTNTQAAVSGYQFGTYGYIGDGSNLFKIQPTIPTFRGHDFHFLLAEAETHLGHFDVARTILNDGFTNRFPDKKLPEDQDYWYPKYSTWLGGDTPSSSTPTSNPRGTGNQGIAGAANGTLHALPLPQETNLTEMQLKQMYDWAIADEYIKEYLAEGKAYSYLCKMADRWSNAGRGDRSAACDSVIARIAPKYSAATQAKVRSSITTDGYFIRWDLKD